MDVFTTEYADARLLIKFKLNEIEKDPDTRLLKNTIAPLSCFLRIANSKKTAVLHHSGSWLDPYAIIHLKKV